MAFWRVARLVSLVVDSVSKRFASVVALDRVSFAVREGEIFGFLGPNGAGKTTTMRIILGIIPPDEGRVTWRGRPTSEVPRRTWGYLPEERGLYLRMTVLDQLVFLAGLYGLPAARARRAALDWLERFRIAGYADRRAEELSKGNQQKVQFIAAILHDPEVLIMDEPFTGLDPLNVGLLREALLELRGRGKTLIFSTHQMEAVEALCESIAIVDRGRIVVSGPLRAVKRSTGRRVVRLAVEANGSAPPNLGWLGRLAGVRVVRAGVDSAELEVGEDRDPRAILHAALDRGVRIARFEIADPSIEQIFVERVGRPPDEDERHLAGPVPTVSEGRPDEPRGGRPDEAASRPDGPPAHEPPASSRTDR
ncbi:MAG TPA: ATP-binding cassette domain-containing protein [Candidatus Limnocylindrales bacterium]|nr:ATP-binding cassette domain-containing protein [Candidatus Limnocylindrales bacterium]